MKERAKEPDFIVWIVVAFIFFPPMGMPLMAMRLMPNRRTGLKNGQTLFTVSGAFFLLYIWLLLPTETDQMLNIIFSTYFVGITAIAGLIVSQILIQRGRKDAKYVSAIEKHNLKKIQDIAAAVKTKPEAAINYLEQMIIDEIFPNGAFNADRTEFILDKNTVIEKVRTFRCPGCGATVIATTAGGTVCEYCGSPVNFY